MADGWRCPVCGRGVSPDQKTCDHNGGLGTLPYQPFTVPTTWEPNTTWIPPTTWGGGSIDNTGRWTDWWYDEKGERHEISGGPGNA